MQSRATFGVAGALLLGLAQSAFAAEDVVVQAERQGESVEVRASATVAAPLLLVWEVLTDYEALPRFIPGIARSVVRERRGNRLVVEQAGEARFLLFAFPIDVRLEVTERPPEWIVSHAAGGNLRRMSGRYDIQADPERRTCLLRYRGAIEPDFPLPPLVGIAALRSMVEEQFTAMVTEIERRAAAAPK